MEKENKEKEVANGKVGMTQAADQMHNRSD